MMRWTRAAENIFRLAIPESLKAQIRKEAEADAIHNNPPQNFTVDTRNLCHVIYAHLTKRRAK
jgi:hypothetical protein